MSIEELEAERKALQRWDFDPKLPKDDPSYGHDLHHAVQHAQMRRRKQLAGKLYQQAETDHPRIAFAQSLHALVRTAIEHGDTAEQLRRVLTREATSTDSGSLERQVRDYGPKEAE